MNVLPRVRPAQHNHRPHRVSPLYRSVFLGILGVLSFSTTGCERFFPTAQSEARFPQELISELLDADPEKASATLETKFPGSERSHGAFARYQIHGSEVLDEIILFQDVRSNRINSVVLKYKPSLSQPDTAEVFRESKHPDILTRLQTEEVVEVDHQHSLTLRARKADRFGRLTLTVEGAR